MPATSYVGILGQESFFPVLRSSIHVEDLRVYNGLSCVKLTVE